MTCARSILKSRTSPSAEKVWREKTAKPFSFRLRSTENWPRQRSRARKSNLPKRTLSIFVKHRGIESNRFVHISGNAAVAPTNTSNTRTSSRSNHARSTTFLNESENSKTFRCVQRSEERRVGKEW